uniref:Uncharacterized protein n=1 Tax=Clytia hemisphaerica TaxID=252671 RepID=A0A7M5U0N6_9CNID|eukprot:TCONS_00012607-protein
MGVLLQAKHKNKPVTDSNDITLNVNGHKRRNSYEGRGDGPGEDFLDMLLKSQGSRLDDQRVDFPKQRVSSTNGTRPSKTKSSTKNSKKNSSKKQSAKPEHSKEGFMDLVARLQGDRMDEQRCSLPELPGLVTEAKKKLIENQKQQQQQKPNQEVPDDAFLDMLMRCQASRINDQRVEFPPIPRGPTVPDEDFFNLIARLQSKRIDTQRVSFDTRKYSC